MPRMPATIEQIAGFLDAEGLKYRIEDGFIRTGFQTSNYRDTDGDAGIQLAIALEKLEHDGEFIKVVAPNIYRYPEGPHKAALFQTLLTISWDTKMIQYEYDPRDGEVRAIIEFPLADSALTQRQLMYCIHGLTALAEENHETVMAAMTKGELPERESDEEMAAMWAEFQAFMEQKKRGQAAGGDHGLPG
jgi:hypothetical protein